MADYKDIITGTIGNIVGKVKDVANSGVIRDFCEQGTNRAKSYGHIAKLTLEINGETEELKRVYTEIGKLYYEQSKDAPEGFFVPLFAHAEEITAKLNAMEDEINEMRNMYDSTGADNDIEVEFEEIVDATEDDGCGKED